MPASSRLLLIFLSLLSWTCHSPSQDPRLPDLAIHHAMVLTMDAKMTVLERGNVLIKGGQIVAVLPDTGKEVPEALKMLDGTGKLLMPGLINTHTHAPMTLFRGLADDLDLKDWLEKHIWPAEARYMKPDVIRLGTKLAMAEMIRGGTTTFNDMYFFVDAMAEEVDQAGMRAILSEGLLDFPTPSFADPEAAMAETRRVAKRWKVHPRIRIGVGPHSAYTLSGERLQAARMLADSLGTLLHIHLSETQTELSVIGDRTGMRPPQWLDQLGLWQHRPTAVAHGVWLDSVDRRTLIRQGVGLAHCPESNMKLASGIAPVRAWLSEGGKLGLGTDGASSNNNLDMWQELHTAAKLHKVADLDPLAVKAREAVRMATIGGAEILGWDREIGSIEVGKKADLILLNLDAPHAVPLYDPYAHLAYAAQAHDVETVIIEGQLIMKERNLLSLDEKKIVKEVNSLALQIKQADQKSAEN